MKIDLTHLLGGEIEQLRLDYPLTIPDDLVDATFPNSARVLGTITSKAGYTALNAEIIFEYKTSCDRCLKPLDKTFKIMFARTLAPAGSLENEDNDEYLIFKDRMLDPDDDILEEILLQFPSKHLCRDDCKGLCPICGKDLNEGSCACSCKEIDPRLAGLAKLLEKNKEQ